MAQLFETEGNYFLLAAFIVPLLIYIYNHVKASNMPPGPTPWPILGNIPHMLSSKPHIALANLAKTYGPLISLRLGTQYLIVCSSPEVAKEILKTKDRIFSGRHVPHSVSIPKSELNQISLGWAEECNDSWKYLRTICKTELFSSKSLECQASLAEKNIKDLWSYVKDREGEILRIPDLVFATVFNILGNALMSRDFIHLHEKNDDGGLKGYLRSYIENLASPNLADFYPFFSKFDLQGIRKKSSDFDARLRGVWEHIIEERRQRKASSFAKQDFLDTLLKNHCNNNRINQLFTELLSAGSDTTTSTVEWTMAELMKNAESMKKIQEEIEIEIKPDFPKSFRSMHLPYLQACMKETLRLHPPAPFLLPHRALETCQVMNYAIPKNTQVMVNVWSIGRDPDIWEDPLKYKPERFIGSNVDFKGNDFEFLPFGAGRRICPGLPMAVKTVQLILVLLIHFFDWKVPEKSDPTELNMNEKFGVTMQMEHPLLLIPRDRNST